MSVATATTSPSLAAPPVPAGRRVLALDGIRGVAALAVMCFHFGHADMARGAGRYVGAISQLGWIGVELFFVLSGFLITGVLLDARDEPAFFRTFYWRRALRILPLYLVYLCVLVYVVAPRLSDAPSDLAARQGWLWTYLSNVDIALHGWYQGAGGPAAHLWSLAIEEQFYLVFPVLVFLLPRSRLVGAVLGLLVVSVVGREVLYLIGSPARAAYVLTFTRLDGLALGALVALQARASEGLNSAVPGARVVLMAALGTVAVLTLLLRGLSYTQWPVLRIGLPAISLAGAALLVLCVAPHGDAWLRRPFEHASVRYAGLISYSLYIWHPLVGTVLVRLGVAERIASAMAWSFGAYAVTFIVKSAVAILAATVSYRWIERPFLALKDRRDGASARIPADLPVP